MKSSRRSQRGMTLIMVTICLVLFIGIAALAIDVGMLYTARTSAQHAADAAALGGAYEFVNPCNQGTPPASCTGWNLADAVRNSAIRIAAQNKILGKPVVVDAADVDVSEVSSGRVTVTVRRTGSDGIATYFARIFGVQKANVLAVATAEAGVSAPGGPGGSASHCLKPIFLPNTILSTNATPCAAGEVIFEQSGTSYVPTAWAQSKFNLETIIRPTTPSVAREGLAPSQFYSLDFGNGTYNGSEIGGADAYRCTLGHCLNVCGISSILHCGSGNELTAIDVETGNMVGPTTDGVNNLIGNPPQDNWTAFQQRLSEGGEAVSPSLAVAPVWDNCNQTVHPGTNNDIRVVGFVQIFIDSVVQSGSSRGDVSAHIMRPIDCEEVSEGGVPVTPGTGPQTVPIRLVNRPKT